MQLNSRYLILLLSLLFLLLIFFNAKKDVLIGEWTSIKNFKDPHVTKITEFTVGEHNKQSKTSLKLKKVVKGETQVVSRMSYRLVLKTKDGTAAKTYRAIMWEKAWQNFKILTFFNLVQG